MSSVSPKGRSLLTAAGGGDTEKDRLLAPGANPTYSGSEAVKAMEAGGSSGNGAAMASPVASSSSSAAAATATAEEPAKEDKGSTLVIAFVLMLVFQLGNRIFGRLETFPMHNYPLFMNMLSTVVYIPISYMYIIPMICANKISKEQREIPQYKFAIMGMWDSVAGIMQTFAVNYISNSSTIVLVQQSAIPISMAISQITLQARYTSAQYLGAAVVLMGIVVVLIPTLLGSDASASASASATPTTSSSVELVWIFILVLSCVPMCLSSVYKEKALGEVEIDVVYLNGCVAVYQFLISLPLCIPSASAINMPISGILPNMWGGMLCWFGINSLPTDQCASAPMLVNTYLVFNIVYNILIIVILKHGSANIMWMASTVIVPLSNVAFSLDFMPGHKPLKSWDIVGLFVIMFGLVIYRFMPQLLAVWNKLTGKQESEEEIEAQKQARLIGSQAESKQTKYVGLNQIEAIQSLFDTRVLKETKKALYRSPQQIRGTLLLKLGIPPSPMISMGTIKDARGNYTTSPSLQRYPNGRPVSKPITPVQAIPERVTKNKLPPKSSTKRSEEV